VASGDEPMGPAGWRNSPVCPGLCWPPSAVRRPQRGPGG